MEVDQQFRDFMQGQDPEPMNYGEDVNNDEIFKDAVSPENPMLFNLQESGKKVELPNNEENGGLTPQ